MLKTMNWGYKSADGYTQTAKQKTKRIPLLTGYDEQTRGFGYGYFDRLSMQSMHRQYLVGQLDFLGFFALEGFKVRDDILGQVGQKLVVASQCLRFVQVGFEGFEGTSVGAGKHKHRDFILNASVQ